MKRILILLMFASLLGCTNTATVITDVWFVNQEMVVEKCALKSGITGVKTTDCHVETTRKVERYTSPIHYVER